VGIPGTADPEGPLDEEGADEARAFVVQTRMFSYIGVFMFVVSVGYGAWTREPAGSAMLALAGGLATVTAAYLGWPRHPHRADAAAQTAERQEREGTAVTDRDDETPWFPAASVWPFAVAFAVFLVANGLLLGLWLFLPAGAVLFAAVYGFVAQSRRRA